MTENDTHAPINLCNIVVCSVLVIFFLPLFDQKEEVSTEKQDHYYKVEKHPLLRDVLMVNGSGPHADITSVEKEIIVDLHCGNAVLRGANIYIPGVMAAYPCEYV